MHERAPAIEVDDVVFRYAPGTPDILRGVSLRIDRGDFVALIGQNGAGKTTLAKHFNGLLRPSAGAVRVLGTDAHTAGLADLARTVGYVYQNPDHQIFAQREHTVDQRARGDECNPCLDLRLAFAGHGTKGQIRHRQRRERQHVETGECGRAQKRSCQRCACSPTR